MKFIFIFVFSIFLSGSSNIPVDQQYLNECVILLHGFGDIKLSMNFLEKECQKSGYTTYNLGYSTAGETISSLSDKLLTDLIDDCIQKGFSKIHFVTHSLGGLIVRFYLQSNSLPKGSRIVMLSPPNKGTEVADFLKSNVLYQLFAGDVGQELCTDSEIIRNLKELNIEIGIIAGNKSFNPFFSEIIPGEDDGRISIENTKLDNMADFLIVNGSHLTIKHRREVSEQMLYFLRNGKFQQDE
ncbi:MAG: alpha/beta hydrolase [Candidatus Cloacimonetes bacterium]|nr:alpha/beta hydrolase [Candidatus Cloacimonadota bacterium]